MRTLKKKRFYCHYKGSIYYVKEVGTHTETEEEMVIYRCIKGDTRTWIRPKEMFLSEMEDGVENPLGQTYRFEEIKGLKKHFLNLIKLTIVNLKTNF